jgi:hypothetical protein
MLPKIYADFHNLDDENRVRLTTIGTKESLLRLGLELQEGMPMTFYMDDADDRGSPDDIMVDGVVHFSAAERIWVASVDWNTVYHASDVPVPVGRTNR